jgi:serine/threonine-protein kinase HipA
MEFAYDPAWVGSVESRPLSLSLPLNFDGVPLKGDKVGFFFDNLLPDSEAIRQRIRSRFGTSTASAYDLLEAVGRDCVGALQLLPEGQKPKGTKTISVTPLTELEVERRLLEAVSQPRGVQSDDAFRISIAGAQEKTALTWHDGRWCSPHGATPTTHILKLPLGLVGGRQMDMTTSLENEWLCAQLLEAYGVPVASCQVKQFGSTRALVVQRFDRLLHPSGRYWLRLPQEDFCQATGTPSSRKYEADDGPGVTDLARLLQGSTTWESDLATLLRAQLLFCGVTSEPTAFQEAQARHGGPRGDEEALPPRRDRTSPLQPDGAAMRARRRHGEHHRRRGGSDSLRDRDRRGAHPQGVPG